MFRLRAGRAVAFTARLLKKEINRFFLNRIREKGRYTTYRPLFLPGFHHLMHPPFPAAEPFLFPS